MSYHKNQLLEMKDYYNQLKQMCMYEFSGLPEGNLWCSDNGHRKQFYVGEYKSGKIVRRCINRDRDTIKGLARKKFLEKLIIEIETNIVVLDRTIAEFRECDPKIIIDEMEGAYRKISSDYFFSNIAEKRSRAGDRQNAGDYRIAGMNNGSDDFLDDIDEMSMTEEEVMKARYERHKNWADDTYIRSSYRQEDLIEVTTKGDLMRSKSEVLLAELFYKHGIPFRYEDATDYPWLGIIPDFEFRDKYKKLFYLEYCGMMDNEEYVDRFLYKRSRYEDNGLYEWNDVIYIFEKGNRVNMPMIESIIKTRIMPRL